MNAAHFPLHLARIVRSDMQPYRTLAVLTSANLAEPHQAKMRRKKMMTTKMTRICLLLRATRPAAPRKPRSRRFRLDNDKRGSLAPWSKSF